MQEKIKGFINSFGIPRIIIIVFFLFLCTLAIMLKMPADMILSDILAWTGMNGVLVLAMVPGILCGIGMNFGIQIGIVCGLLGGLISIELNLTGFTAFLGAILISIPFAALMGYVYGILLNKVRGSEMMVATYAGFSIVSVMCIGWLLLPFKNPEMKWPMGIGVRNTIALANNKYDKILNHFLEIKIGDFVFPTGLLLFFGFCCLLVWLFLRSRTGIALKAGGDNPVFAAASGIDVNTTRVLGTVLSTVIGAAGIIVYSQSYGFYQLYQAPLMMSFPAVAAVLIGGASAKKASISHVIIGTFLFQGLLAVAMPVANKLVPTGNLAEVVRIVVSNGIILYALTKAGGGE